jgi:hypothetical protein
MGFMYRSQPYLKHLMKGVNKMIKWKINKKCDFFVDHSRQYHNIPSKGQLPATHNYTSARWGHAVGKIDQVDTHGNIFDLMGHGSGIYDNDYILINGEHGGTIRFRVDKIYYFFDPHDMWSARVVSDPEKNK